MLRRAVGDLEHLGIVADRAQRPRQTDRVAGQVDRAHVGELLAASADRKLHEAADERRNDRQHDRDDEQDGGESPTAPAVAVAIPPASPEPEGVAQEPVGDERDAPNQHAHQQREPDVEVAHVAHLVADDALQLLAVHLLEEPGRGRDRGVLRISSGRERVRRRVVDDVDLRHRYAGSQAHLGDDVHELLVLIGRIGDRHLLRTGAGEHQPISAEVGADAHHHRDDHGDDDTRPPVPGGVTDDAAKHAEHHDHHADQQPAVAPVAVDLAKERGWRERVGHRSGESAWSVRS